MKIPEILAPAGNRETLETACIYGADAVYLGATGGTNLRAGAKNFGPHELCQAVNFAHARGVKVYLTLNIFAHDRDMAAVAESVRLARRAGVDAVIVSDLGVMLLVRELAPELEIHISTQANTVNSRSVKAWEDLGAKRVILARELSAAEISEIRRSTTAELEIFVHGSVCISISGRCLISYYLNERDANLGACTQPCRWGYSLQEETRPQERFPIVEDAEHTYLYNSKDICLLPVIDQVLNLGIDGLKVEGRNKTALYVATVISAYRRAVDAWKADPENFEIDPQWLAEIAMVSNRGFFTGFFEHAPDEKSIRYELRNYDQTHHLAAKVLERRGQRWLLEARNPLIEGMELEWLGHAGQRAAFILQGALADGAPVSRLRPNQLFELELPCTPCPGELLRKPFSSGDKVV